MEGGEDCFCIDSKLIEVCCFSRFKRCGMGKKDFEKAPLIGYCISQGVYYCGYIFFFVLSFTVRKRRSSATPLQSFPIINFQLKKFQLSNGKRTNELKYCFNNHSWALSLIMA